MIDENGNIAYKGGNGPFKYDPKEVRSWLAARYGEVKHEDAKPADGKRETASPERRKAGGHCAGVARPLRNRPIRR